ncbi:protein BREAST CANCER SUSCEPTIBILITY 1-like protein isoform X1 [Senna tora]|uniref:Protein BREAST CANCER SUSCEPTIBILITY 1-like protein isoform X1 n=1 Tax=Senna tora TaxID=362788 RepID=A0A834XCI6_9FABA|nr:protein BREAST CANCER SUSCEPTIBILITY 1-like protein isoform X1 [Senna tora]
MGDPIHLEKMGRELKCPICWSLLNSAVSLTCNHVFCNSCIEKSMKSDSSCPVCKVPFRRREVRPAPHMDNLVSIYKSMEISSGINIFVTQNVPVTRLSDGEKQCEGGAHCGEKSDGDTRKNQSTTNSTRKRNRSRKETETSMKSSGSDTIKPSFPTKKRVQVPQSPLSETPLKFAKFGDSLSEINKEGRKEGTDTSNERPLRSEKEKISLSPFFWLRDEENGEKLSQGTVADLLTDTPTPNPPSFSDLKDSDDENPPKVVPSDEVQDKVIDLFDSETFEWTQRPCSPELCSSPLKTQVAYTGEVDENQEKDFVADSLDPEANQLSADNTEIAISKQGNDLTEVLPPSAVYPEKKYRRKGRKATEKARKEHTAPALPSISEILSNGEGKRVMDSTASPREQERERDFNLKNSRKSQRKRSGKQKLDNVQNVVEESSPMQNLNESSGSPLLISSLQMDINGKASNSRQNESSSVRKSKSYNKELKSSKKLKLSSDCISQHTHSEEAQPIPDSEVLNDSSKERHCSWKDEVVLQKCKTRMKEIQCAFCLSSEESEASGQMVHYYNGKPVTADYEGGSIVIHSHRNCTEWAPNVYFEDDIAINLEAEISRSRRIKCGFCGVKGAALGCYEKSCRRSFHVPCAKLTSTCRWDMDNFVILCPLHASLKLPCESSGTQNRRNKRTATEQSKQRSNMAGKHDSCFQNLTAHASYKKIVLCCSALSGLERDVVSEFERATKVTVLKKWDASVTHVIASIDENGACKRTLKVLQGILEGKWILNVEWIKASLKAKEPVDEEPYEITVDIHGIRDGPRLGRLRILNKQPKLFDGYKFYFMGDFLPSYKGYLQDLVIAAGGIILQRKPVCGDQKAKSSETERHPTQSLILYSLEFPDNLDPSKKDTILSQRQYNAEALAGSTGSKAASNSWILNSIAACKLQSLAP